MDCNVWFEYQLPLQLKPSISVSAWGFLWGWFYRCTGLCPGAPSWHPQGSITPLAPGTHNTGWATLKQDCNLGRFRKSSACLKDPLEKFQWLMLAEQLPEALLWTCLHRPSGSAREMCDAKVFGTVSYQQVLYLLLWAYYSHSLRLKLMLKGQHCSVSIFSSLPLLVER